jgi:hypothetical protein
MNLKKYTKTKIALISLIAVGGLLFVNQAPSFAASTAGWDPGNIMTDDIFTNSGALNPTQIQAFLESKNPSCDTWGTQPSEFGGGTRAQWGTAHGVPPPYTCLKDYVEGGIGSAHIIYNAAQTFQINPEVLIVLLQKEQGLVTDQWPLPSQYRSATGYGCPDTAACDSQYYGLTNQIQWAARMFRAIQNNSPTWYTPYVVGNNYIRYSPDSSCGGSTVNIRNRATQALYNYTPYQPNAAALAAGYGTAPCGAYGNRNFFLYFTDWFGSTTTAPSFSWRVHDQQIIVGGVTQSTTVINMNPGQTLTVVVKARNTGNQTWSNTNVALGTSRPNNHESIFRDGSWPFYNRPAILQESSVAPGEIGTFSFTITAPNKVMSSREYFNILTEGIRWHDDIGMYFTVNVANPAGTYYNAVITDKKLYRDAARTQPVISGTAIKGSKLYGTITFTNTGNNPFDSSTLLATTTARDRTSALQDTSWISSNRLAAINSPPLQPSQSGTVNFTLQLPDSIGSFNENFALLQEGVAWMDLDKANFTFSTVPTPVTTLPTGSYLDPGQYLSSADLRHQLVLQGDGNLVLYTSGRPVWSTSTMGTPNPRLVMQGDGNLVLYAQGGRPVWATMRTSSGASTLVLQDDRNLVTYSLSGAPTWATYTNQ